MPLKSVHITNYYHKNSGGISTSFNNLMAAAERHKRYVRLIVPGETESIEEVNEYAKIYYVPAKHSPIIDKRYRVMMPWQYMVGDSIIRKILMAEQPDFVEITDKYTLSMFGAMIRLNKFSELGRPMVVHFSCERMDDNIASFVNGGRFGRWLSRLVIGNYTLPSFDYHIANSSYTAEEFFNAVDRNANKSRSKWFINACWRALRSPRVAVNERIFVCPRGVDITQYSPERRSDGIRQEMQTLANIPKTAKILLYAGRISPEKNVGLLVEMMKVLAKDPAHDYRLLIAGAGPQSDWLKEEGEKACPGKMIQLGHVDKDVLAGFYANADVFVHPNPREPFGIAPLEAMASGVPTLAPNSGGILSYASNENAWLVEPNGEDFAAAVREIIDNDELRNRKVTNALATAKDNTREASTDFLLATYDKIYADFQNRKELFTDAAAAKKFDFSPLTNA